MKEFYMTEASKNKSLLRMLVPLVRVLLELFIVIIIYTYLRMAIPLVILSLPFVLSDYFFNNKQIDLPIVYGYVAFVFTTIFLALLMIRKHGAKTFWEIMIHYSRFTGKSGKYFKYLVYFIISLMIIILLDLFLQAFF